MKQPEFVKLQQDIIDQELREMPATEVDDILVDMKAWEAFDFLERIGHLRAWVFYESLRECTGCEEQGAEFQKLDAGNKVTWWHKSCWESFLVWLRGEV